VERDDEVAGLVEALADGDHVFGCSGVLTGAGIAAAIYALVLDVQARLAAVGWERSSQGPTCEHDITWALEQVPQSAGIEQLAQFSAVEFVFDTECRDLATARGWAAQLAARLGSGTVWWSNYGGEGRGWYPVTCQTFDGVVAAVAPDGRFAALLRVDED
jgi:hypothetical protein